MRTKILPLLMIAGIGCDTAPQPATTGPGVQALAGAGQDGVVQLRGVDGAALTGADVMSMLNGATGVDEILTVDQVGGASHTALVDLSARLTTLEDEIIIHNTGPAGGVGIDAQVATAPWICPGFLVRGVCVVSYRGDVGRPWLEAVNACTVERADLCTASQYVVLRETESWSGDDHFSLFFDNLPVWTSAFSDNDLDAKTWLQHSADDPDAWDARYNYACCQNIVPEPFRSNVRVWQPEGGTTGNGVWTTYVHAIADTSFPASSHVCAQMGADLCSKSQYVVLGDNDVFGVTPPGLWTNEMSDNDGDNFDTILGATVSTDPNWANRWAYACCGSQRPLDNSCPGEAYAGVCATAIHDPLVGDTNFYDAARACADLGADVCSKSQMQVLRNFAVFVGESWTNDGADNDSYSGGLAAQQVDDPQPDTYMMGYACCL